MRITFDQAKRDLTLKHRGLDFARASEVFAGQTAISIDVGSTMARHVLSRRAISRTAGGHSLDERDEARHIISMRYCHAKEEKLWREQMG